MGRRPPHLLEKTRKHKHFQITPILYEVVELTRLESTHSSAQGGPLRNSTNVILLIIYLANIYFNAILYKN